MTDRDCRECEHFDREKGFCNELGFNMVYAVHEGSCNHFKSREDEAPTRKITKLTWKIWRGTPPLYKKCDCNDPVMYDTEIYGTDHYYDHILLCNGCITSLRNEMIPKKKEPIQEEKKEVSMKGKKTCEYCKYWDLSDGITDTDGVMIRACASPSWRGKFESRSTNSCKYWEEREEETKMKEEETCKRCNHWAGKGSKPPANEHTFRCYNTQYKWTYEGDTCSDWKEREGEKEMKNHEFKPGDRVIIDVEGKDRTESPVISDSMMEMHGQEHVIGGQRSHNGWYFIQGNGRAWNWNPKWLRASTRHGTVLEDVPSGRYYCEARDRERGRYCGEFAVRGVTRSAFFCYPQDVVRYACEKHLGKLLTKEGDEEEMKEPTCPTCEEEEKGQQPFERALETYTAELAKETKQAAKKLKEESALETEHLKVVDSILTEAEYLLEFNDGYKRLSGKDLDRRGFYFGKNGFRYRGDSCPEIYVKFWKHKGHKRSLEIGEGRIVIDKLVYFKNGKRTKYCTTGRLTKALRAIEGAIKQ